MSAIRFTGVSKNRGAARRAVNVLRNVSFSLDGGEVVLLAGPSGSGKTTILGVAAGLLTADSGEIEIRGVRIDRATSHQRIALRSSALGVIFQRPSLLSGLTARENVQLMAAVAGMQPRAGRAETDRLFERLEIAGLAQRLPRELSGGEEQRVGIARALVHGPSVILADEPTASLDASTGDAVISMILTLAVERKVAVLVATHDLRLRRFATRCLHLADGAVSEEVIR